MVFSTNDIIDLPTSAVDQWGRERKLVGGEKRADVKKKQKGRSERESLHEQGRIELVRAEEAVTECNAICLSARQ